MKKINNYTLQYWLYAVLNKKFGSEVKFKRDVLHSRYEVNRHGFSISTNTLAIEQVSKYLEQYLTTCGYVEENNCGKFFKKNNIYVSVNLYDKHIYCMGRKY